MGAANHSTRCSEQHRCAAKATDEAQNVVPFEPLDARRTVRHYGGISREAPGCELYGWFQVASVGAVGAARG